MELREMSGFIEDSRARFRSIIEMEKESTVILDFLEAMKKRCCSKFEEDTLFENLTEEYGLYLRKLVS